MADLLRTDAAGKSRRNRLLWRYRHSLLDYPRYLNTANLLHDDASLWQEKPWTKIGSRGSVDRFDRRYSHQAGPNSTCVIFL